MSFSTVNTCANDPELQARILACIAQEQQSRGEQVYPATHLELMRWTVSSAADVEAAYASALATNNPHPGGDESVVTDGMILAHVQAGWPAP